MDSYFNRPEVSNSDLSSLKKLLYGADITHDPTQAYAFGTLIDNMITEPEKVDYFNRKIGDYTYSTEEFELAKEMKRAFLKDDFCRHIAQASSFQAVSIQHDWKVEYGAIEFELDVRCKWDLLIKKWNMGADIKSTVATTQKQFEEACDHFDYFRSRAFYMDIEGTEKDMLIGISKKNLKIFKIPIARGDKLYNKGKEEYQELAFKYWMLFGKRKF